MAKAKAKPRAEQAAGQFPKIGDMRRMPLAQLMLAAEAPKGHGIDVRKAKDDAASFATLKASINAVGIIVPLVVHMADGEMYILSGNRRLRALRELEAEGAPIDRAVPVVIAEGSGVPEARELALMSNIGLPMHPVDQYEVLAGASGSSATDLAARWGLTDRRVSQILALGALAPEVRQAWRDGKIDAKTAQTFTLGDNAQQLRVLKKLGGGQIGDWQVKRDLVGSKADNGKLVAFVGLDAYRAAGGTVREDLFGTDHVVDDAKLLKKLADEKLDAAIQGLVTEGWQWAMVEPSDSFYYGTIPPSKKAKMTADEQERIAAANAAESSHEDDDEYDGETAWEAQQRIERTVLARSFSPEERARSGCFVGIDDDGGLRVRPGRIKPEAKRSAKAQESADKRKKKAKKAAAAGEAPGLVSNALMQRLSEQLTAATSEALQAGGTSTERIALAALIAGVRSLDKACAITERGLMTKKDAGRKAVPSFKSVFEDALSLKPADLQHALIALVSRALDFQVFRGDQAPLDDKGVRALVEAIDPGIMHRALLKHADLADYFKSVSRPMVVHALKEMGQAEQGLKALSKLSKNELAEYTAKTAAATKTWLPPEFRTLHYSDRLGAPKAGKKKKSK